MSVVFFLPGEPDLDRLKDLSPDHDWRRFQLGEHAWVLQTYLRLASRGMAVRLSDTVPRQGIVVFHAKHKHQLAARADSSCRDLVLVGIRADNSEPLIADFEILQNGRFRNRRRRFSIPHWPQPGLLPRDPARGCCIRRVAYKGFDRNLHPDLRSSAWQSFLEDRGIEWCIDSVAYSGRETDASIVSWADFRDIDVIVAVRPDDRHLLRSKPATKLFNAWKAGVPAILGPEHGYQEMRRSGLDYIEVSSLQEACSAVDELINDPRLYQDMVSNGHERMTEISNEAIADRWSELLFETIPELSCTPGRRMMRSLPFSARVWLRAAARMAALRPSR